MCKSLFFSDTHLSSPFSKVNELYKVLIRYNPENIFILGDFLDTWKINKNFTWNKDCDNILLRLKYLADKGTKIVYTIGNHDNLTSLVGLKLHPNIHICKEYVYSVGERKILLMHGDMFDDYCHKYPILYKCGDVLHTLLLHLNHALPLKTSLSSFFKQRVKSVQRFINNFEERASKHCIEMGCSEIMMGHIHHPDINKSLNGIKYHNTGDFIESCSYIIEEDGELILKYC